MVARYLKLARLEIRNVTKIYNSGGQPLTALNGVSIGAEAGTVTALLGPSGCGKSTLLNLSGAMDFATSGEVSIDGESTATLTDSRLTELRRTKIGFVFQFFQLLPTLTAAENVEIPLLLAGTPNARATAKERLDWVGLPDKLHSYPHQLSGGQMQRVAVARALVHRPHLLIADEPTGNLDSASGAQVLALIQAAARDFGAAVLMATHSEEAAAIASHRIHMRDGKVV